MSSNVNEMQAPFNAVVQVGEVIGGVGGHGSGVFIASDEVLTAAHLVWQQGVGTASDVFVDPALNLPNFYGQFRPDHFHYFAINDASVGAGISQADFALLHFASPISGFGTMTPVANFAGGTVHVTGYPQSAGGNSMFDVTETVTPAASTSTLTNSVVTGGGSSGGPLWVNSGQVVGVVSTTTDAAALSGATLAIINSWIAADHSGQSQPTGAIAVAVPALLHSITTEATPTGVTAAETQLFDTFSYKTNNPDVANSGIDPLVHFVNFGWHEGRNPDPLFDVAYYLSHNPDVAAAGIDPLAHYANFGWREGRDPSASFSTSHYLAVNSDVKLAGINPLLHYVNFGVTEGRSL